MNGLRPQSEKIFRTRSSTLPSLLMFVSLLERKIDYSCSKCVLHFKDRPRFMHMSVCLCVCGVHHVPGTCNGQKTCPISWNQSYRQLWAGTWVQGTEPASPVRSVSTCNSWTISPSPLWVFRHRWFRKSWWSNIQTADETMDVYYLLLFPYLLESLAILKKKGNGIIEARGSWNPAKRQTISIPSPTPAPWE